MTVLTSLPVLTQHIADERHETWAIVLVAGEMVMPLPAWVASADQARYDVLAVVEPHDEWHAA